MVFGPVDSAPCITDVPQVTVPTIGLGVQPGLIHPKHREGLRIRSPPRVAMIRSPRGRPCCRAPSLVTPRVLRPHIRCGTLERGRRHLCLSQDLGPRAYAPGYMLPKLVQPRPEGTKSLPRCGRTHGCPPPLQARPGVGKLRGIYSNFE
ncbi:hypothetical protein E2562_024061 [Oryza meyeriana var. granulata]|uniref:Uncharacterized protein n=1 Tax=Oryza meyeriana var. granulata TaxID=110450 RepID=A0A6G1CSI2_9ORYZ|nr:hypothetical protein E2562_024061 [Oryza meyeriana var. granulata]